MPTHRDNRSRTPSPYSGKRRQASADRSNADTHSYRTKQYSDDSFYSDEDSDYSEKKSSPRANGKKWRGGGGGRGGRGGGGNKGQSSTPRAMDATTKRMLSARRIKINELKNETESLNAQLSELRGENRTMRRQHAISERVLDKYEAQENDMGNILTRHGEEVRALREQAKKQKDKYSRTSKKLRDTEEELEKTRRLLKKMRGLVDDNQLAERDDLAKKLSKAEHKAEASEKKVTELERYSENLQKNHRHEFGIERARHKETRRQLDELTQQMQHLQSTLKEKEKEIEVHNIYSMRLMKPPHRLSSVHSTPVPAGRGSRQRKNSDPSATPRARRRLYEDARKQDLRRSREPTASLYEGSEDENGDDDRADERLEASSEVIPEDSAVATRSQDQKKVHKRSQLDKSYRHVHDEKLYSTPPPPPPQKKAQKSTERKLESPVQAQKPQVNGSQDPFFLTQDDRDDDEDDDDAEAGKAHLQSSSRTKTDTTNGSLDAGGRKQAPSQPPPREDSVPMFDLNNQKAATGNPKSKKQQQQQQPVREDSIPLFDLKNPSPKKKSDPPSTLKSNPQQSDRIYRSYKDEPQKDSTKPAKTEEDGSYKPTWLASNPKSTNKKQPREAEAKNRSKVDERLRKEQEERERAEREAREERERREREERERRAREEREKQERDERAWWEKNQKEKEEEERLRKLQEQEDDAKQWQAKRDAQKNEAEKLRREKEREEERRAQEEEQERRRRREQEELQRNAEQERQRLENDAQERERQLQKQQLLARMREIDDTQGKGKGDDLGSPGESKKDWRFTDAIENMHKGKPSHEVSVPVLEKQRRRSKKSFLDDDDDDLGGYQPTFTSNTKPAGRSQPQNNHKKKGNLMEDLFGNDAPSSSASRNKSGTKPSGVRENSRTQLFGGGSALIDDDDDEPPPRGNSHLLPRRTRQPTTTISSKPTVNAVDDFEDDIEELKI